jgi:hypothetical protein
MPLPNDAVFLGAKFQKSKCRTIAQSPVPAGKTESMSAPFPSVAGSRVGGLSVAHLTQEQADWGQRDDGGPGWEWRHRPKPAGP